MDNIIKKIEDRFFNIPFKHRGIFITHEMIQATIEILNEQKNKEMLQMCANLKVEDTKDGLDKELKLRLNTDLRMANIISDVLEQVGVVEIIKLENPLTGRMVNATKLLIY